MSFLLLGNLLLFPLLGGVSHGGHIACEDSSVAFYFDGVESAESTGIRGAKATIRDRKIKLCNNTSGATSGGSTWVMLGGGDSIDYAQIGYMQAAGWAAERAFVEWSTSNTNWYRNTYSWFNAGSAHTYKVQYSSDDERIHFYRGSTAVDTSPVVTNSWNFSNGWDGEWYGETKDGADHVSGTTDYKTDFTSLGVKSCYNGCSYVNPWGMTVFQVKPGFHKFQWVTSPTSFNIWTYGT